VEKGVANGKRPELTGGGLIRSVGGWAAAKELRRANALQKGDEQILGDGEFVDAVLHDSVMKKETELIFIHANS
jgi:hypothetical protein